MKEDQEQKCHVCRFCKQSFSNGKKLGGHMRRHLALISACRKMGTQETNQEAINGEKGLDVSDHDDDDQVIKKIRGIRQDYDTRKQSMQENDQEVINGETGLDFDDGDDVVTRKNQQEMDADQDYRANVYVLRENPKRSWRVSNSSKDFVSKALATRKRCHSRKESMKHGVCEKCGKSFNSMKALYGHMRCHSIRRSRPFDESSLMPSSEEHDDEDEEVATPVRKKRSCTRYNSPKPNHHAASLSSSSDEVEKGAICLMMLSKGVRNLDKLVTLQTNLEFEVSADGSMEWCKLKNRCRLGLKKDLIVESGSGQLNPVKCKSPKNPRSCDQDFGDMDATDSDISLELKRRSKDHNCPICLKEFGSGHALGCHKRVHNNIPDVHRLGNPDLDFLRKVSTMVTWDSS